MQVVIDGSESGSGHCKSVGDNPIFITPFPSSSVYLVGILRVFDVQNIRPDPYDRPYKLLLLVFALGLDKMDSHTILFMHLFYLPYPLSHTYHIVVECIQRRSS